MCGVFWTIKTDKCVNVYIIYHFIMQLIAHFIICSTLLWFIPCCCCFLYTIIVFSTYSLSCCTLYYLFQTLTNWYFKSSIVEWKFRENCESMVKIVNDFDSNYERVKVKWATVLQGAATDYRPYLFAIALPLDWSLVNILIKIWILH